MFTIENIKAAHAKVKSGADFPAYVRELIQMGVQRYTHFVADGHIVYEGANGYTAEALAKYPHVQVNEHSSSETLKSSLKIHQQGGSDYLTFCKQSAYAGVDNWIVDMHAMTCAYSDKAGNEIVLEQIPTA